MSFWTEQRAKQGLFSTYATNVAEAATKAERDVLIRQYSGEGMQSYWLAEAAGVTEARIKQIIK